MKKEIKNLTKAFWWLSLTFIMFIILYFVWDDYKLLFTDKKNRELEIIVLIYLGYIFVYYFIFSFFYWVVGLSYIFLFKKYLKKYF